MPVARVAGRIAGQQPHDGYQADADETQRQQAEGFLVGIVARPDPPEIIHDPGDRVSMPQEQERDEAGKNENADIAPMNVHDSDTGVEGEHSLGIVFEYSNRPENKRKD